ncbi:hypothetical protein WM32_21890 [Burkholderia ubonensis]|uniref:DUF3396 domain-containing protein n=1 Tax=Burkholderia ubonensis TaxID=101571 RepID=UPI0007558F28|nr:DUF3396 domain-containing protein [Burkholderia ubonensis]KWN70706.1 hypothetical protein WM23_33550 [Burkholderia ubonensis]KWO82684.1 hypothetical protein WM32_21890 [Burkholderia ubonensis]
MTKDELIAWANDPNRAGTLPFGAFEPKHQRPIIGAALAVRAVIYFKGGHTPAKRKALVACFQRYDDALQTYQRAVEKAAGRAPSKGSPLRWLYQDGKQPVELEKGPSVASLSTSIPADAPYVLAVSNAEDKQEAGTMEFSTFCLEDWQASLNRGMDVVTFSVPQAFLTFCSGVFEALFAQAVREFDAVNGHAGYAANLSLLNRGPNEASEYFWARKYGPGLDVGDPMRRNLRRLTDRIKTVDWLTAINADLVRELGGADKLSLPPDWFLKMPYDDGGLIIQAGVAPQTGIAGEQGHPPEPPPAYVLLNNALRPIVANAIGTLQTGSATSTAPLLNTQVATEAWLRRLDVEPDHINAYWVELHKTPKLRNPDE